MKLPIKLSSIYLYIGFYLILFVLMFLLQSFSDPFYIWHEVFFLSLPHDLKGFAKAIIYLLSYMSCVVLILIMLMLKSKGLWRVFLASVVLFYFVDFFIQFLSNSRGFTKFEYELGLIEANNFKNIIIFLKDILKAIALSLAVGFLLIAIRRNIPQTLSMRWSLFFPVSIAIILISSTAISSINTGSFPASVKVPAIILNHHLTHEEYPPRILGENIKPENSPRVKNIIWIIDESVGGGYLSANGFNKSTTPDVEKEISKGLISNYGMVNSIANCSAKSNFLLRIGINPSDDSNFKNDVKTLPTIFQYAKHAGFKTSLYDAQVVKGNLQNRLTPSDMKHVDTYVTLDRSIIPHERDSLILPQLINDLKKGGSEYNFIVLVKWGAHWPYLMAYPKDKIVFKPVRETTFEAMTLKNREKTINTYSNLIKFTVNDFLVGYMQQIDQSNSVTFYTSDHGQSIIENGINRTHCSLENAPSSQANVPLMVINSKAKERFPIDDNKVYSQHQIFPTTLSLMGYSNKIISKYGPTLMEGKSPDQKRWFYWSRHGDKKLFTVDATTQ